MKLKIRNRTDILVSVIVIVFAVGLSFIGSSEAHPGAVKDGGTKDNDHQVDLNAHRGQAQKQDGKQYENVEHWFNSASQSTAAKLRIRPLAKRAKNLIMFLGDGFSLATLTAGRIYKGQTEGTEYGFGEEGVLHMDTFPYLGTSKTYCSNWQVADSACSATAYLCGTKGNAHTLGVSPDVILGNCTLQMDPKNQMSSILEWAQAAGMSTGIVTTAGVTHASPAAAYAHAGHREWENDAKVAGWGEDPEFCDDIAEQLVLHQPGSKINVILGGGRENFYDSSVADVEFPDQFGGRSDGKDLVEAWKENRNAAGDLSEYVTGRDQLLALDLNRTDYLLGLFAMYHMEYKNEQAGANDPSLAEMTEVAIKILSRNPNGYFLFVEGGRIDHAHHGNWPMRALIETVEFDKAIQLGDQMTNDDDTLIVVTADHSHLFSIAGDPDRGNPILGLSGNTDNGDGLPHATLGYVNGPGYRPAALGPDNATHCPRVDVSDDPFEADTHRYLSMVPRGSATHAGEDVIIHAKGPWAHLLTGTNDQSYIPHAMAFAACINPNGRPNSCDGHNDDDEKEEPTTESDGDGNGAAGPPAELVALIALVSVSAFMATIPYLSS